MVIALGFLVYTGLGDNMVYYYPVDEFAKKAPLLTGDIIKINGHVAVGTVKKQGMDYDFIVQGTGSNQVHVSYTGIVPDTFKEGSDVVVEGKYDAEARLFHCTTLMAKCPSKYEEKK